MFYLLFEWRFYWTNLLLILLEMQLHCHWQIVSQVLLLALLFSVSLVIWLLKVGFQLKRLLHKVSLTLVQFLFCDSNDNLIIVRFSWLVWYNEHIFGNRTDNLSPSDLVTGERFNIFQPRLPTQNLAGFTLWPFFLNYKFTLITSSFWKTIIYPRALNKKVFGNTFLCVLISFI